MSVIPLVDYSRLFLSTHLRDIFGSDWYKEHFICQSLWGLYSGYIRVNEETLNALLLQCLDGLGERWREEQPNLNLWSDNFIIEKGDTFRTIVLLGIYKRICTVPGILNNQIPQPVQLTDLLTLILEPIK